MFVQISCGRSSRVTPDYTRLQDAFSSANRLFARATNPSELPRHSSPWPRIVRQFTTFWTTNSRPGILFRKRRSVAMTSYVTIQVPLHGFQHAYLARYW
jgi:hypothetical protein